ncbi:hypothetical protein PGTUg99_017064 [Puccinia graminis f. sp. tritici]|uniref:Uncharacterized protein n=1 Tax=Puccinia graminis f. sp. tritici TaxID=56615 RepID=A0A5B0P0D9_PUCGR|nr:hypothetical protein PGTUg99_017064 [Puccinia graminis f. sp. tritici]
MNGDVPLNTRRVRILRVRLAHDRIGQNHGRIVTLGLIASGLVTTGLKLHEWLILQEVRHHIRRVTLKS